MTKDELKAYVLEAVDALDAADLELLFPPNNQPDLYSVVEELTGLKGAFNKLSGSNLKLNHEIHQLVEMVTEQQQQQENFLLNLKEEEAPPTEIPLDADLKGILQQMLDMDELFQLTEENYRELPELGWLNKNTFKTRFAAWQKGFDITIDRWKKLLQSNNLYKTGLVGEIFDPELHEAIAVKHQNNQSDNIILETEQTGFLYKGKVIRLAKVVVNKVKEIKREISIEPTVIQEDLQLKDNEIEPSASSEVAKLPDTSLVKSKPKPKRKKGAGGRRKKRKRKRKK